MTFGQADDGIAQAIKINIIIQHEGMRQVKGRAEIAALFGMQNRNLFRGQRIEFHFRCAAGVRFDLDLGSGLSRFWCRRQGNGRWCRCFNGWRYLCGQCRDRRGV